MIDRLIFCTVIRSWVFRKRKICRHYELTNKIWWFEICVQSNDKIIEIGKFAFLEQINSPVRFLIVMPNFSINFLSIHRLSQREHFIPEFFKNVPTTILHKQIRCVDAIVCILYFHVCTIGHFLYSQRWKQHIETIHKMLYIKCNDELNGNSLKTRQQPNNKYKAQWTSDVHE